jgi:hypothetical protein
MVTGWVANLLPDCDTSSRRAMHLFDAFGNFLDFVSLAALFISSSNCANIETFATTLLLLFS